MFLIAAKTVLSSILTLNLSIYTKSYLQFVVLIKLAVKWNYAILGALTQKTINFIPSRDFCPYYNNDHSSEKTSRYTVADTKFFISLRDPGPVCSHVA